MTVDSRERVEQIVAGPAGRVLLARLSGLYMQVADEDPYQIVSNSIPGLVSDADRDSRTVGATLALRRAIPEPDVISGMTNEATLAAVVAHLVSNWYFDRVATELSLALEDVQEVFVDVAKALTLAPAASWWWTPFARDHQLYVGSRTGSPPPSGVIVKRLAEEAGREIARPIEPIGASSGSASGIWWSIPSSHQLLSTCLDTKNGLPPTSVFLASDWSPGDEGSGYSVWRSLPKEDARIYEIDRPVDWTNLVQRYPSSPVGYRPDWERISRIAGPWIVPDWSLFSEDWDGLYVSIDGFLSSDGLAQQVESGYTMLAGAVPWQTLWFSDRMENAVWLYDADLSNRTGARALNADEPPWWRGIGPAGSTT